MFQSSHLASLIPVLSVAVPVAALAVNLALDLAGLILDRDHRSPR